MAAFSTQYWERGQPDMRTTQPFHNLIYDNKEVFSLHDEDLDYCDWVKHTTPAMMDKPVYLPHHTIPRQLQGEVCKCIDTWLPQDII